MVAQEQPEETPHYRGVDKPLADVPGLGSSFFILDSGRAALAVAALGQHFRIVSRHAANQLRRAPSGRCACLPTCTRHIDRPGYHGDDDQDAGDHSDVVNDLLRNEREEAQAVVGHRTVE